MSALRTYAAVEQPGSTFCDGGVPVCVSPGLLDAGTSCGSNLVCDVTGNCNACTAGASCMPAECRAGQVVCSTGAAVCTEQGAGPNGGACDAGSCYAGACRPLLFIDAPVNLSTDVLTAGRICPEAPSFPVTSLSASSATLSAAPDAGCLVPGDRVLLINLQGTSTDLANIGRYELMTVASVSGGTVGFTAARTQALGNADGGETDLSTDAGQKVALFRVPELGDVVVGDAGVVTSAPWNGFTGGVVAFRALSLTVHGSVTAAGLGYREGDWSQDDSDCTQSLTTGNGESITGPSEHSTSAQAGGAGGLGAASIPFNSNGPLNASAGHGDAGEPGQNPNGRVVGPPGSAYGEATGARLTMGSGASGNLTCTFAFSGPPRYINFGSNAGEVGNYAGGIVYLAADAITVADGGSITASARAPIRSTASSGGYVLLRGRALDLGALRVTAQGQVAVALPRTETNRSSDGYVVLQYVNSVAGTSAPAAFTTQIGSP